jgi:hypothetical protein
MTSLPSFPRKRESSDFGARRKGERRWIPAFAGMTVRDGR